MKKIRYWWWFTSALVLKYKKLILYVAVLSILSISLAPRLLPLLTRFRMSSTIGMIGRFRVTELPPAITKKISLGLTEIDETGLATPGLGKSWVVSEDGKTYTFTLDSSKHWQDGTPVESTDLHFDIESVAIKTPDKQTIVFQLEEPFAPFPTVLSKPIFKTGLIGVGDFRVKSIKKNGEFIEKISLTGPNAQTVIYRFYRTTQDLVTALKLGEVSSIQDLTTRNDIPSWSELTITPKLNFDRYTAVFFNTKDEALSEKSFRQALTYAIPNKSSGNERALSPINPHSWAYNPQVKPYSTDIGQAKELLKTVFGENDIPSLELTTFLPYVSEADQIAKAWTQIGVKTEVKVATSIPENFQALLIGQQIPSDPDQYILWHSTQLTNITHYSSPKVDKLLEDGRKTIDQNKRMEIYHDFQRFLLEDCPAAFLEHITTYSVTRK